MTTPSLVVWQWLGNIVFTIILYQSWLGWIPVDWNWWWGSHCTGWSKSDEELQNIGVSDFRVGMTARSVIMCVCLVVVVERGPYRSYCPTLSSHQFDAVWGVMVCIFPFPIAFLHSFITLSLGCNLGINFSFHLRCNKNFWHMNYSFHTLSVVGQCQLCKECYLKRYFLSKDWFADSCELGQTTVW